MPKPIRPTTILDDGQAQALAKSVRAFLGPALAGRIDEMGLDMHGNGLGEYLNGPEGEKTIPGEAHQVGRPRD